MSIPPSFPAAAAKGLPMLGGRDIFTDVNGLRVRGHLWQIQNDTRKKPTKHPARAKIRQVIIICPGFTEFCEKYSPTGKRLHDAGYDMLIIDWPGQGRSGHLGVQPLAVHIDSFEDHLAAADSLITVAGLQDAPRIIIGHSMGGHLALRLAERGRQITRGAIILAPMIAPPATPVWAIRLLATLFVKAGFSRRYIPGYKGVPLAAARLFHLGNSLTRNQAGYEAPFAWFDDAGELRRSGPTSGWLRAAYDSCVATTLSPDWMRALDLPVLALTAGDETVVHKASTDRMLAFLPDCQHHEFRDARHELLYETDQVTRDLWDHIFQFLASTEG